MIDPLPPPSPFDDAYAAVVPQRADVPTPQSQEPIIDQLTRANAEIARLRARIAELEPPPDSVFEDGIKWVSAALYQAEEHYAETLRAENARLRAGIETLRREHDSGYEQHNIGGSWIVGGCPKANKEWRGIWGPAICNCGADAHNARIDALLAGETP